MHKRQRTPKDALTDVLLEFIEAAVHEFLFIAGVYPAESFEHRALYDVPVHMNRYPELCEYIHSMLAGCRDWIHSGDVEKLCVAVLSDKGSTLETLVIETRWAMAATTTAHATNAHSVNDYESASSSSSAPDGVSQALPLRAIEDTFRTALVALLAAPRPRRRPEHAKQLQPTSFRLLVHTREDVSRPGVALSDTTDNAANAWVLADPFWHDSSEAESPTHATKQLLPIKSMRADALPFTFQLYVETP